MTPEQLQQLIDAMAAQGGAVDSLNEKLEKLSDAQLKVVQAQKEASDQAIQDKINQETAARERLTRALDAQERVLEKELATVTDENEAYRIKNELIDVQIEKLQRLLQAEEGNTEAIEENIAALRRQRKEREQESKKKAKEDEEFKKRLQDQKAAMDDLAGSMSSLLSGTAPDIKNILNADNIGGVIKKFQMLDGNIEGLLKKAGPQMALEFATAMAHLAVDLGNAENAFMKATGANEDFARSITNTYEEGRKFTVSAGEIGESAISLFNTFSDFTFENQKTRESLIQTGAVLEKLGISNESFAQGIQVATKGLGMSADEAGQAMLDLSGFAEELGVSPERLSKQFLDASDSLQKLGSNGDEAFRDLAAAAKVTGMEVNKILNLVNRFDTFEGAARQAGKLNAALGGNFVNAMDLMMETDPTARFEMIRDAILDSGESFDTMSYYQKNFYKDALGLESVGDLALMLSGNLESVSEETKMTSRDFEEQAEKAKKVASFQEQLNAVFQQMIPILTPLIDGFRHLLTFLSDNATAVKLLGSVFLLAFGGLPGIIVGLISLADTIKLGTDKVSLLSVYLEGFRKGLQPMIDGFKEVKQAFIEAMGPMDGLGMTTDSLIPLIKGLAEGIALFGTMFARYGIIPILKIFAFLLGNTAKAVRFVMDAFAEKNSPSFFDMFTDGLLVKSIDALMVPFNSFKSMLETIGGIFSSIMGGVVTFFTALTDPAAADNIQKIAAAIAEVPISNAFALGSTMKDIGETLKIQTTSADNDVMNKSIQTSAGLSEAAFQRTAAPTAANTNIAQNSSNNTYISSGPENAVIDVRIGDEKIGRVVQKIQNKRTTSAISGRS